MTVKAEYEIRVCSECGELLEDDRDYGFMPVGECPRRCGYLVEGTGTMMRALQGDVETVRVAPV